MKLLHLALCLPLAALTSRSLFADTPSSFPQTRVSLAYSEFRDLFDAARINSPPKSDTPESAFVSAVYEIDWAGDKNLVEAHWRIENFTANRKLVPVAPNSLGIVASEKNEAVFLSDENQLSIVLRKEGVQEAHVRFASTVTEGANAHYTVKFPVLPAATNLLKLRNVPPGVRVAFHGGSELPAPNGERQFAFSTIDSDVQLTLEEARSHLPSRWEWRSEVVVVPGDASLAFHVRLVSSLLEGDGREMRIPLPRDIRGIRPSSEGLDSWRVESDKNNQPVLLLAWNDKAPAERVVELRYATPMGANAEAWTLNAPQSTLPGSGNLFAILHSPSTELSGQGLVARTDAVPLSDWMRSQIKGREFSLIRADGTARVNVQWLPLAEPANLIGRQAKFQTRIVSDGSTLTEAAMELECESSARWVFQLPPSAKLLRCAVNGHAVRPVRRDSALELLIDPASRDEKTTVTFSYTDNLPALDPVSGGVTITLPETKVFVHKLEWSLEIPAGYEVAGIESNAEVLPSNKKGRLELGRELVDGTPVVAELFYSKRGIQQ